GVYQVDESPQTASSASPASARNGIRPCQASDVAGQCACSVPNPKTPLIDPHQSQKPAINKRATGLSWACQVRYGLRPLSKITSKREVAMPGCVRDRIAVMAVGAAAVLVANAANAEKKYDPGASDTEIRIGNIMPYSGPASSYGVIGKAEAA